jgi:hypothetical protein
MTGTADVWASFSHDPRLEANAGLRASDVDRDVVHQLLAEAYADGRLDRDELDTRTEQVGVARTLGELPPLMSDLVASGTPTAGGLVPLTGDDLRQRAVAKYESDRREAFLGFLGPSLICIVIWLVVNNPNFADAFFWPGFVIAGTGINLLRTLIRRQDLIEENVQRLQKKQAKDQARNRARELENKPPEEGTE